MRLQSGSAPGTGDVSSGDWLGSAVLPWPGARCGGDAEAARRGYTGPPGAKRDDCPAYCEDDDLLIIQAEIGGICAPYLRFWCGGGLVCVDGVCRSSI